MDQLAAKQITQSSVLNAKQGTAPAPGTSSLTLNTASKSFNVTISVAAGRKNSSVLSKTAQGINDLHAGFKARVAADSLGNRQLVVESEKTGKNNSFSIGGALGQSLGLDQVTQASADAATTYNGKAYTTENNSVTLDDGDTRLDLRAVTDEPSVLNRSPDTSGLEDA